MQSIYVKAYFPKQRSVALAVVVGLLLTLLYLLGNSTKASGATAPGAPTIGLAVGEQSSDKAPGDFTGDTLPPSAP